MVLGEVPPRKSPKKVCDTKEYNFTYKLSELPCIYTNKYIYEQ